MTAPRLRPLLMLLPLLAACGPSSSPDPSTPATADRLVFLRDAVIGPAGSGGQAIAGGREVVSRTWSPGEAVTLGNRTDPAPARPECVPLFRVELGDVDGQIARGISTPGTSLAWSPDGDRLAVGSYVGEVLVLDGWTGDVLARRKLAETTIKQVAWSADGAVVYAGEQSPDAYVHALAAGDLTTRWSFRLADELKTSPPPPVEDVYGVFTLPAAYGVEVLRYGDLLVLGMHAWPVGDDTKRNLGRVWRLSADGEVVAAWPPDRPARATIRYPRLDEDAGLVAFPMGYTGTGEPPSDLPIPGLQVLALDDLKPRASVVHEPLAPHFNQVSVWEAIDVDGRTGRVLVGIGDGRLELHPTSAGAAAAAHDLGTPIVSGDVPIAASVSWGEFLPDGGYVVTTGHTAIPWGSDVAATRPPSPYPGENTVWAFGPDDALRWNFHAEPTLQGVAISPDGRRLVVGGGPRPSDHRRDLFGATVFRLDGEGSGEDRLEVTCPTEAPVFFRLAATDDGRVAVSEVPYKDEADDRVRGEYRVTVLR